MQKLVHVSSTLTLQKNLMQEMTRHITDLSKHNFNNIHGPDDDDPESTHMDETDSQMLMDITESGQFDTET